ncbi:MAG TPA: putative sulfate exporter family transporter [Syntrophobacteraceae bacterium]|nr:putative sulfate exporter family transporter [Syntrophobacteraceae bacterium]
MDTNDQPSTDYCETKICADEAPPAPAPMGWKELYLKEDWWAIYLGIGLMLVALIAFSQGSNSIKSLVINPGGVKWSSPGQLVGHFQQNLHLYLLQLFFWLVILGISTKIMGIKLSQFLPGFIFLYILSVVMFSISGWVNAAKYNLEPPLVALILGLILANVVSLPKWLDAGFRVEYYIKTGIVLLGATFPVTLIVTAGPVALLQATIISITTCLVIYFAATRFFGLDKRLASVIGVGGSVCGVSASMAIASSVNAKKEDLYTSVTLVVVWALVMIVVLPFVCKLLGLAAGVAGAWIGTSEFADAAGFAAASAYGKMAGNENAAIQGFTLMKVIGRDMWIGIWSFVFAMIACLKWEKEECGVRPNAMEIWWRFPKFVIGFFIATLLMTGVTAGYTTALFNSSVKPNLILPLVSIRTWLFIFCFLSIGLTTRFRELKAAGWKPFGAFTTGVVVNVILGFVLSVFVFGSYWSALGK